MQRATKNTLTPHVASATVGVEITVTFGATGSNVTHEVTIPLGARCVKLDGGSNPWVLDDLTCVSNKFGYGSMAHHDADHYGVRVPEGALTNIKED